MTTRRFSTAFFSLFAALLTTAGLALVLALPAQAHSQLISSDPADGAELREYPPEITLEFNEDIQAIGNEIVVTDPSGSDVADGELQIDGPFVVQPLAAAETPPIGVYTVTWRVVSADGHPISGEFTFEVLGNTWDDVVTDDPTTDDPTTEEATAEEATDAAEEATSSPEVENISSGPGLALPIIVAVLVVAAAVVAALVIRKKRAR